jgi:peptidoglycan-N-acetylglucosamine deacetylase
VFPYKSPQLLRWIYPSLIWEVPSENNEMFLTFDDGPTPIVTDWVLDCLKEYKQNATFFCIGENVVNHPTVYSRIREAGHSLGNHTMHHKDGFGTSLKNYLKDVEECAEHVDSNLFRPPYGRIKRNQLKSLIKDYKIVEWTVISRDYYVKLNRNESLEALKTSTKQGAVVVFHDSERAFDNLKEILPKYLDFLAQNRYKSRSL